MQNPNHKYWIGAIENCDLCHKPIKDVFIDGSTLYGPWATMCKHCFNVRGRGVGTGKGQMYELQPDGQWLKIQG